MGGTDFLYNAIFKKTSTLSLFMVIGAYFVDAGIDVTAEAIFNSINRGKLWDHIKDNYKPKEVEAEEPPSTGSC